jgi:hypothetical protein
MPPALKLAGAPAYAAFARIGIAEPDCRQCPAPPNVIASDVIMRAFAERSPGQTTAGSSRVSGASAQKKINEATGKFSPCRGEAANIVELLAQFCEAN